MEGGGEYLLDTVGASLAWLHGALVWSGWALLSVGGKGARNQDSSAIHDLLWSQGKQLLAYLAKQGIICM